MDFPVLPAIPSAPSYTESTQAFVEDLISTSHANATAAIADARTAINELGTVLADVKIPSPPTPPTIQTNFSGSIGAGGQAIPDFGSVDAMSVSPFTPDAIVIPDIVAEIPPYIPIITGYSLPDAPAPAVVSLPTPPGLDLSFDIPGSAPTPDYGSIPDLAQIDLPSFNVDSLEPFTDATPTFDANVPDPGIIWTEPKYNAWIADTLKATLQQMLNGGTGIPVVVEKAIWERDRGRLDIAAAAEIQSANDEWAAKGFNLPPGALMARTMGVRRDNRVELSKQSREVAIKQADLEQANRQFAVKSGTELENIFVSIFNGQAQRAFDIAKLTVDYKIQIYNAQVTEFNVRKEIFGLAVEKFKTKLQYVLSQIDAYKARIEAEKTKVEINKDLIDAFTAKVTAFNSQVEAYKALISAATAKADLQKTKIELYKGEIEGVQAVLSAKKSEFDAYTARIQGESAKATLEEANAKAYEARVGAITAVAEITLKEADIKLAVSKQKLDFALGELTRLGAYAQVQLQQIQARVSAYEAESHREEVNLQLSRSQAELALQATIEAAKVQIAFYQAKIEEWKESVTALVQFTTVNADAIKAAGQIAATLAAGALAGTSVSAGFSGTVGLSQSQQQSESYQASVHEATTTAFSTSVANNTNTNISA